MLNLIKKHWPILAVIGVLLVTLAVYLVLSIEKTEGHLIYALDDPYIHMAMAKNFVQHGVWGVTKYSFTSSSSSLLWTFMLSLMFFFFGVSDSIPFILNVAFAICLCVLFYILLRKYKLKNIHIFITLSLIIFLTPLSPLIFCGQEHVLQILITVLFVYVSIEILVKDRATLVELFLSLMLAMLLGLVRYEGLFLLFVVSCLLLAKRQPLHAILLCGTSIIPIVVYGLYSVSQGWYFFPNSVLLKGNTPMSFSFLGIIAFLSDFVRRMLIIKHSHITMFLLAIPVLFYLRFKKYKKIWDDCTILIVIVGVTAFLHALFARIGSFNRYEAYIVSLGIFVIAISSPRQMFEEYQSVAGKKKLFRYVVPISFLFLFIFPFVARGIIAFEKLPQTTKNIYEQQYQMGLFLKEFYQGEGVAANDIGAICYLADINCFDLVGLANMEVARAKRKGNYYTQTIDELTKSAHDKIAIVYDSWFQNKMAIPSHWVKVGKWTIMNNRICAHDNVSFYAVYPAERDNLVKNLTAFSSRLPKGVVQTGVYIKPRRVK